MAVMLTLVIQTVTQRLIHCAIIQQQITDMVELIVAVRYMHQPHAPQEHIQQLHLQPNGVAAMLPVTVWIV